MGLFNTLKLSLELALPERATRAFEKFREITPLTATKTPPETKVAPPPARPQFRRLIELIDIRRHGGLTFGQDSIERMSIALADVMDVSVEENHSYDMEQAATAILDIAVDGVRDPKRLKDLAIAELANNVLEPAHLSGQSDLGKTANVSTPMKND